MQFNINDFFYNLVAGGFFLGYWTYSLNLLNNQTIRDLLIKYSNYDELILSFAIIIILGIGLILHGLWRGFKKLISLDGTEKEQKPFFERNNLLWLTNKYALPGFFNDRAALWGSFVMSALVSLIFEQSIINRLVLLATALMYFSLYKADRRRVKNMVFDMVKILKNNPRLISLEHLILTEEESTNE